MTSDNTGTGKRVYTKRSLAQRAAEAQDKATKLQAAANRQRERCLIELGAALVSVLRGMGRREAWVAELAKRDVRNHRRRAEAIAWLRQELGLPDPEDDEAPVEEFKVPTGVIPPQK